MKEFKTGFEDISRLFLLFSKPFAEDVLRLLANYETISASETASRLGLHIKTAQDFLEGITTLDVAGKKEVNEKKRPYFRYFLKTSTIKFEIDLKSIAYPDDLSSHLKQKIREKKDSGAMFTASPSGDLISSVSIFEGTGRKKKERKISLTSVQGRFLFHLPFPGAEAKTISEILKDSELKDVKVTEILEIVDFLVKEEIIEKL